MRSACSSSRAISSRWDGCSRSARLARAPVDLRTLITELVGQRPDRSRINVSIQEEQSFKVSADAARVAQALTAMLDEAGMASDEDVRIEAERRAMGVEVAVSIGVAPNDTTLRPAEDDERVVGLELARSFEATACTFALFRLPVSLARRRHSPAASFHGRALVNRYPQDLDGEVEPPHAPAT